MLRPLPSLRTNIVGRPASFSLNPGLNLARRFSTHSQFDSRRYAGRGRKCINGLLMAELRRPNIVAGACIVGAKSFHCTPRNEGVPLIPILATVLKTSTALDFAGTAVRVALTFVPVILLKNCKSKSTLKKAEAHNHPDLEKKRNVLLKHMRQRTLIVHALLFVPIVLFWATILASMERTPLTGRWRLILLSPEEEEDIAAQLAGPGWYQAVGEILSQDGTPQLIPPTDWRLTWVRDTLRRLETVIPILQQEKALGTRWIECGPDDIPMPPPAEYPLRPRMRASEYLRRFCEMSCARTVQPAPHAIPGPPYSLIVVDKPDSSNAFSYGFGPDGGGGIVVFSGFLDDVLAKHPAPVETRPAPQESSWWSSLFGGIFSSTPRVPPHPVPTEEQTSELAILLAHELAHLVLAHHLETLSSGSIIWPGVLSIATDVVRALLFPVTMLFGPFVNDALAGMGKIGTGEFTKLTEYCTSQHQEIEADIVSARLLAHAGFDPRHAVHFWEKRHDTPQTPNSPQTPECSSQPSGMQQFRQWEQSTRSLPLPWTSSTHPLNNERVSRLRGELDRWEAQRRIARDRLRAQAQEQKQ